MRTTVSPTITDELLGRGRPDHTALIDGDHAISGLDLVDRVASRRRELDLAPRSIVVLSGDTSLEWVSTYLALLDAGHVPLLAGDHAEHLAAAWAAATVHADRTRCDVSTRRAVQHEVHPDLALLLSTSGSTGSPKLVRISRRNLLANASAIVDYLGLNETDRAITSLPLHYCYGLSVLHSHLLAGASVVLTDASVVDPCFADAVRTHGVTSLAGVPHTFDMLERVGPDRIGVPSLRRLTQAGGRMAPDAVTRWTTRAETWGARFYVMYGQTEATARMAFLPPELALRHPAAIGRAIPGGELRVEPVEGQPDDVGELVYRGPNVMMGYAERPSDLAEGALLDELRTGDLARFHTDDGVFEIVGRRSRFVKPFGLRIDLDQVEQAVRDAVHSDATERDVAVGGDDERIVAVAPGADATTILGVVTSLTGLPASLVHVVTDAEPPRTRSGKTDYAQLLALAPPSCSTPSNTGSHRQTRDALVAMYAEVLSNHAVGLDDTFVSLGGDSLSYVECSLRLEQLLGRVPTDWHLMSIEALADSTAPGRRVGRLDTTVLFRAIGICLIVATHMRIWFWPGGAHLLLAVAGFNLARFMMPIESTRDRVFAGLRTVARVAVPAVLWVAVGMVLFGAYSTGTLLLVNNYVGPATHRDDHWTFWFIEVFVHLVVITTALLAIPAVRRLERRFPYGFPFALLLVVLNLRWEVFQMDDFYNMRFRTHGVAWFFVLGWLVCRSGTRRQKFLTTALCAVTAPGFFGYAPREWFIAGALVLLVWCREVPFPGRAARPVGVVAAASMWIFITHFTFWPLFADVTDQYVAFGLTVATGVVCWLAADRATGFAIDQVARVRAVYSARRASPHPPHRQYRPGPRRVRIGLRHRLRWDGVELAGSSNDIT